MPAAALAVFVGHLFPVFHRFAGGKGVATAAGIVFALHWPLGLALALVWLVMAFGFKISSLAALTTAALMPLGAFYVFGNTPTAWAMVPIALLLFWRHRGQHPAAASTASETHDRALTRDAARARVRRGRQRREFPARLHRERVVAALRLREAQRADERDHRAVVGAELEIGKEHLRRRVARRAAASRARSSRLAPTPPATTSRVASRRVERRQRLRDEHVDDRVLEFARDVGRAAHRRAPRARCLAPHERQHRGLEAGEAHVEIAAVEHRPRQRHRAVAARFGEPRERRAARIGKPEQLRRLVERFARRVVLRVAEQPVAPDAVDVEELAVAAGHEQRDERKRRAADRRAAATAGGLRGDGRR